MENPHLPHDACRLSRYPPRGPRSWWSNTNVILADEMGLGKTIQTLAFVRSILHERPSSEHRPVLVICPLSTTDNWERELEMWCPELNCVRFVGNMKSRTVALE
ncbi:unnamed protein product, partial [Ectocarpus sp. 8 AP-2014]